MKLQELLAVCNCKKHIYDTEGNSISDDGEYFNVHNYLDWQVTKVDFQDYFGIQITIEKTKQTFTTVRGTRLSVLDKKTEKNS